eukprot:scaffold83097_cov69-Phaeocystis_antarctica.AAC.6
MRRQPRTWAHRAVGAEDNWPPLELAVARPFVGCKVCSGAHASTVPQHDKVLIWATQERAWLIGNRLMSNQGMRLHAPISTASLSTNTRFPTRMPERR